MHLPCPASQAGMEGVDPEHVKRVVYEASKVGRQAWALTAMLWSPLGSQGSTLLCPLRPPDTLCSLATNPNSNPVQDSSHYANEQRKDAAVEQKIARMQALAQALTPAELATHTASMDARLAELEGQRDLSRTWWVLGAVMCGRVGACVRGQWADEPLCFAVL